jgi:hypothetical protein
MLVVPALMEEAVAKNDLTYRVPENYMRGAGDIYFSGKAMQQELDNAEDGTPTRNNGPFHHIVMEQLSGRVADKEANISTSRCWLWNNCHSWIESNWTPRSV